MCGVAVLVVVQKQPKFGTSLGLKTSISVQSCGQASGVALMQISVYITHNNLTVHEIMDAMCTVYKNLVSTRLKWHMRQTITEGIQVLWRKSAHFLPLKCIICFCFFDAFLSTFLVHLRKLYSYRQNASVTAEACFCCGPHKLVSSQPFLCLQHLVPLRPQKQLRRLHKLKEETLLWRLKKSTSVSLESVPIEVNQHNYRLCVDCVWGIYLDLMFFPRTDLPTRNQVQKNPQQSIWTGGLGTDP